MHPKRNTRRPLLWGLILVAGLGAAATQGQQPAPPMPAVGEAQVDIKTGALVVPLGGLVSFDPKLDKKDVLTDVIVAREDILQVRLDPNNPGKLLMTGKASGLTQLSLVFKDSPKKVYDVIVQPDLNLLRSLIRRTVPTAAVDVQPGIGNVIVLSGYVTSPQDADIVTRLATSAVGNESNLINAVQVGGGQQVQIDVVVASVDRTLLRERGFDFSIPGSTVNFSSIVSGLLTGTGGAGAIPTPTGAANLQLGIIPAPFVAAMRALRTEGVAKFLAEPRVVTQSGRPASFLAGGRQAIISGTSGITGPGVELVPFGTELEVLPIVYGNGMIWLEINPRISTPNQGLGLVLGGTATPGFTEQQVRTAVMLESGQTYAIGGLIQNSVDSSSSKVPLLGDLPFTGTLFSRVTHQQRESELVILVTPRLVGPMNCDQVPRRLPGRETRNPDDYELFLENIMEAPRGQRKVWNGRCYNAAWKCDPTACIFPCVGNVCTGPNCGTAACGPNGGCATVGAGVGPTIYSRPAVGGVVVPNTLPPVPGGSGVRRSDGAESAPAGFPSAPPPVVVIPEFPRN